MSMDTIIKVKGISADDPIVKEMQETKKALEAGRKSSRMIVGPQSCMYCGLFGCEGECHEQ